MTDRAISSLPAAADLTGAEAMWVGQSGDKLASVDQFAKYFRDTANITAANSNITLIINGDSKSNLMAQMPSAGSAVWWAMARYQLEIRAAVGIGVGGSTTGSTEANSNGAKAELNSPSRIAQMVAAVQAAINAGTTPIGILETGTNDPLSLTGGVTPEYTLANVRRYIAQCKAAGMFKTLLCTIDPRGSSAQPYTPMTEDHAMAILAVNHGYRQIALNDPFVIFVDPSPLLLVPATDPYNKFYANAGYGIGGQSFQADTFAGPGTMYDGWLHESQLGAYLKSEAIGQALSTLCKKRAPFAQSLGDVGNPAGGNPRGNILGELGVFGGVGGQASQDQTNKSNGGTVTGIDQFPTNNFRQIGGNLNGLNVAISSVPYAPYAGLRPDLVCTRFTFSGTPTADADFNVTALNQRDWTSAANFLWEIDCYCNDLAGTGGIGGMGQAGNNAADSGVGGASTYHPPLKGRHLMYSPNPIPVIVGNGEVNFTKLQITFPAGRVVSGSIDLMSMSIYIEPALPAPSVGEV